MVTSGKVKDLPEKVGQCIPMPEEEVYQLYLLLHKLLDAINTPAETEYCEE